MTLTPEEIAAFNANSAAAAARNNAAAGVTAGSVYNPPVGGAQPGANVANQGRPGYDVFGNPVAGAPSAGGGATLNSGNTSNVTAGSIYSGISGTDSALGGAEAARIAAAKTASEQADPNDPAVQAQIRAATLASFQAEIDAQNAIYADKLSRAKVVGANRLGSTTAAAARGGELGSTFGNAQTDNTNNANEDVYKSIDAEKAAAIGAILSKARDNATAEIAAKTAAKSAGLDNYVKYLTEAGTRSTTNSGKAAQLLLAQKVDLNTMKPDDLSALLNGYGITKDSLTTAYTAAKTAKDEQDTKDALAAQQGADTHAKSVSDIENAKKNAALLDKKFEEDKRQFGLNYAQKERELAMKNGGAAGGSGINYVPGENKVVDSWATRIQNGTAKITEIPSSQVGLRNQVSVALQAMGNSTDGKPTTTELGKAALVTAKDLLTKFDAGKGTSAVGKSGLLGSFGYGLIPGTDRSNFVTDFNSLKSQLSLEGVKYLKGQGQVSDAERALLAAAVTKLNLAQSESEFKDTLNGIIAKLEGNAPKDESAAGTAAPVVAPIPKGTDGATYGHPGYVSDGTQWVLSQ